jgi:hypothetical protein
LLFVVLASVSRFDGLDGRRLVWPAKVSADRPTNRTAVRTPRRWTVVEIRNLITGEAFTRQLVTRSIGILADKLHLASPLTPAGRRFPDRPGSSKKGASSAWV